MSEGRTCPNCGAPLMPADVFCGECGARVRAPDFDVAPDTLIGDVSAESRDERRTEGPPPQAEPMAGEHVPPPAEYAPHPPAERKTSDWTTGRIIAIVLAAGSLLLSLCLCSLGGLMLIPTESQTTTEEDLVMAALCCTPGVVLSLLGVGAAFFGFRKR